MHGSQLFKDLFGKETELAPQHQGGKGRSAHLIKKRDEALLLRYLWYGQHTQLRYDVVLERLSEEFYLSPVRIYNIVQNNYKLLKKLTAENHTEKQLKEKYPHFTWTV